MGQLVLGLAGAGLGSMLGGPIGAQVGWLLGSFAWNLLDPPKVQGPRLQDTKVQGADYGKMRPILYGMARVGGTGMGQGSTSEGPNKFTEHEEKSGGKGGPEITNYRYTLSFFNEICEGPIVGVRRRWANGRLVTDEYAPTSDTWPYVLYLGDTAQLPDPTMETVYGAGDVAAMRGVAYESVEELDCTDYGNARPNVEYEAYTTQPPPELRIIKANYDTGDADVGYPVILDWPLNGQPVVSNLSVATGYFSDIVGGNEYDAETYEVGAAVTDGYTWPDYYGTQQRVGVGQYVYADTSTTYLWAREVTTFGGYPYLTDGSGTFDFCSDAGIPSGLYPVGCALTQDQTSVFVFTSAVGIGSLATHWYKITDGLVVDDGTVSPAVDLRVRGRQSYQLSAIASAAFENNARYLWTFNNNEEAKIYYIDDLGNLADWGGGTLTVSGLFSAIGPTGRQAGCYTLATEGYCGVAIGPGLALLCRLGTPGPAILGDIVADLLERGGLEAAQYDVTDLTQEVRGFVIGSQMTVRNAIDILRKAFFFDVTEYDGKLVCVNRGHDAIDTIPDGDLAAHEPGAQPPEPLEVTRVPEAELPRTVFINYYDAEHDYQPGSQYWRRTVTRSQSDVTLDLPIVFTATEALHRAQWHMHFAWLERDRFTWYTTRKWAKLTPTDVVVVRGVNIRITSRTESPNGLIRFEGVRSFAGPYTSPITDDDSGMSGSPGSGQPPQTPPSSTKADTGLVLIDGPWISEADPANSIRAALYQDGSGNWSGASLYKSVDGGTTYTAVASTTSSAVVGTVASALPTFGGGNVVDEEHVLTVYLHAGTLSSTTESGLQNGLNLVALGAPATGWEFLQFRTATLVDPNTYELTGLLRGRYGTEWMMPLHGADEVFVVIDGTVVVPSPQAEVGLSRQYKAVTYGAAIADATAVAFTNTGVPLKPWAPVLLGGGRDASSNLTLNWTPRRRGSGGWPDGVDLPPTEITTQYRVRIYTTSGYATVARTITVTAATTAYSAADQTTDFGSPPATVYWDVAQLGATGYGYAARGAT